MHKSLLTFANPIRHNGGYLDCWCGKCSLGWSLGWANTIVNGRMAGDSTGTNEAFGLGPNFVAMGGDFARYQ